MRSSHAAAKVSAWFDNEVLKDLTADIDEVARLVESLDDEDWRTPVPAPGWNVADQVAHLTFIFTLARTAAADPATFQKLTAAVAGDFNGAVNAALQQFNRLPPQQLLARFRAEDEASVEALAAVPAGKTVP